MQSYNSRCPFQKWVVLCILHKVLKESSEVGKFIVLQFCKNSNAIGIVRYRLELSVNDGNNMATFVRFDRDAMKVTGTRATEIVDSYSKDDQSGSTDPVVEIHSYLRYVIGKTFTFQLKLTAFNFTTRHKSFTVARILEEDSDLERETRGNKKSGVISCDLALDEKNKQISNSPSSEDLQPIGKKQRCDE